MQIFISIVVTLLILTVLIVIHELGHYIAAKKQGIKVAGFSIGFGPKLFKWMRGETEFAIRPIFAGGYVKFADDIEKEPAPGDLRAAPLKARFITIVAGPLMNLVFAIILAVILLMMTGGYTLFVGDVVPGSPAEKAGILPGDRILKMDGVDLELDVDFALLSDARKGDSSEMIIERDGVTTSLTVPYAQTESGKMIGISFSPEDIRRTNLNLFDAFRLSFKWIWLQTQSIFKALGEVFTGHTENVAGIVGTTQIVGEVATNPIYGFDTMLSIIALISINLAIMNLLPLPALDGGKLVIYAIEGIRKKPVSEKVEGILSLTGFIFLICLSVFLVFQDITRIVA